MLHNFYSYSDYQGEVNDLPSRTEPDQSLTPQDILERFVKGNSSPIAEKQINWNGSDDLDNPNPYDTGYDRDVFDAMDSLDEKFAESQVDLAELISSN